MARQLNRENWLIFVDTNIFLDLYRQPGEAAERQLQALNRHKDSLIICEQIWVEFLKNRQNVILDTIKQLKKPLKISYPAIISEFQPSKMLSKNIESAINNYEKIKSKVEKILKDPTRHDPVYKIIKKIFENNTEYNLKYSNKQMNKIRNLAMRRFMCGYPPRKRNDTSIGDSINWEWIVHCAENSKENHNILIVSRDGDYGIKYDEESILNDWLYREFKSRVSRKRKIELTLKLTTALKRLSEEVKEEDIEQEEKLLQNLKHFQNSTSRKMLENLLEKHMFLETEDIEDIEDIDSKNKLLKYIFDIGETSEE